MPEQWVFLTHYGLTVLGILITIVLGCVVFLVIRRSVDVLVHTNCISAPLRAPLQGGVRGVMVLVVLLVCLQQLGIQLTSLWAGLVTFAAMLAGGFVALASLASNVLCTVLLLVFAPFRIGDEVEIIEATGGRGLRGTVVHLNMMYTSVQPIADDGSRLGIVRVPNTLFFQKALRQWSRAQEENA